MLHLLFRGLICNPGVGTGGAKAYKQPENDDNMVPVSALPFRPVLPASPTLTPTLTLDSGFQVDLKDRQLPFSRTPSQSTVVKTKLTPIQTLK